MGFVSEIFFDSDVNETRSKKIIKWLIRASITLIGAAFVFGQFKMTHLNRLDKIEEKTDRNIELTIDLKDYMDNEFNNVNRRIDKIYSDGYNAFNNFQEQNQKQLELIIDYGGENKDMLKRMLEINHIQTNREIENQLFRQIPQNLAPNNFVEDRNVLFDQQEMGVGYIVPQGNNDTIFLVRGATNEYLDSLKKLGYNIGSITTNTQSPHLIDFRYIKK